MPPLLREWETDYPGFAAGGAEQSLQIQRRGHIPGWLLSAFGRFTFSSRPTGSPSSAPVCARGPLPPGRGKAGRAARCAAPTACTEAVPPFFVGAGHWPAHRCTRRVQESAPLQGAETPTGDRKGCPYGVSSTSTVGSVKPGAEFESHRMQFWGSQAPVGREETQTATQILRAGTFTELLRRGPRSGGLGESRH